MGRSGEVGGSRTQHRDSVETKKKSLIELKRQEVQININEGF